MMLADSFIINGRMLTVVIACFWMHQSVTRTISRTFSMTSLFITKPITTDTSHKNVDGIKTNMKYSIKRMIPL